MKRTYYDIETGPLPREELEELTEPFDPASVKMGNIKDPEKRALKLAESKANYMSDIVDKAALSPLTGQVLAIGTLNVTGSVILAGSEAEILDQFWNIFHERHDFFIGFNSHTFDLPFLVKRSWKHGITVNGIRKGRYWNDRFIDLRDEWQMGDRQAKGSLDAICRHFGIEGKNGNGKDFARMFELNREKALEYLENDLRMTKQVAERMGV